MTSSGMTATMGWTGLVVGALIVATASPVWATDFDPSSQAWNGLAEFVEIADEEGVEFGSEDTLDWEAVESEDVITILYPKSTLDTRSLAEFISDGGRVFLADDFGSSPPFMERLSIQRTEPQAEALPHRDFVDDHVGWPRLTVRGEHPLLDGVDEVVANYPAVIHNVGGPVIAYDEGGGLVYDMKLGQGRAVVVADPGLFINAMLPVADNRELTRNAFRYLCEGEDPCRGWLMVGDFESINQYGESDRDRDLDGVGDRIEAFNERLREVFEDVPATELLYFLAVFLALGLVAYLATVFPWSRARWLSGYMDRFREELSPPLTEFDWNMARFTDSDQRVNYVLPVAILKESFEELFLGAFDLWPSQPGERPSVEGLAHRFDERFSRGLSPAVRRRRRQQVKQLLAELTTVPSRHRVFLDSDEYFSARDMIRLYRRIKEVLEWMELQEVYERRTSEIDAGVIRSRR